MKLTSDQEFWEAYQQLDTILQKRSVGSYPSDLLRGVLGEALHSGLGIVGGAFGLCDQQSNEFVLLQSDKLPPREGIPSIFIPFHLEECRCGLSAKQCDDLIALMFHALRKTQRLNDNPPEFLRYFLGGGRSGRPSSTFERISPGSVMHSSTPEVSFSLYGWRWLLRYAQCFLGEPVEAGRVLCPNERPATLWTSDLWRQSHGESDESRWVEYLRSLALENQFEDAVHAWKLLTAEVDGASEPTLSMAKERRILGIDEAALLDYARYITPPDPVCDNPHDDLDTQIQRAILSWLSNRETAPQDQAPEQQLNAFQLLGRLHRRSRVPVIPYYYLCAAAGRIIDHLIVPLWQADAFPVRLSERRQIQWSVFALLAVEAPVDVPDASVRLGRIRSFLGRLVQPLVDEGFYGAIVRGHIRREGELDTLYDFAHEMFPTVEFVFGQMDRRKLFDRLNPAAFGSFLLFRAQIKRFLKERSFRTQPFLARELKIEKPLDMYVQASAARALERARSPKSSTSCLLAAEALNFKPEPVGAFLARVDFQAPMLSPGIDAIIISEDFAVLLIISLTQALYHSFRILVDNPGLFRKPELEIFADSSCISTVIYNPGEAPRASSEEPHDASNLRQSAQGLGIPIDLVSGPRWVSEDGISGQWETTFRVPLRRGVNQQ